MTFGLLRSNLNYRLLLSGSVTINLGGGVLAVAISWLATLLTRDPLLISVAATAKYLPWFLFALPAGVWTDRADRRILILQADAVRLALVLCLVAMTMSFSPDMAPGPDNAGLVIMLGTIAFLLGIAAVVRGNAAQTLLPAIVHRDELERANGQMWTAEKVIGGFFGPPLAGALISAGIVVPFGFGSAMLALTIGFVWCIKLPARAPIAHKRFWPTLREGCGWMRQNPALLRLAVMLGAINAVSVGGMTVLVLYAQEILHLSATGYGLLLTCGAAGGVLGGLFAADFARWVGMRASLILALTSFVLLHLMLGLFSSVALAGIAMFLEAAGGVLWNVVTVSYRQRLIPDDLLGRVNSIYRFFGWGAMPFGALAAGAVVTALEPSVGRAAALHAPYWVGALVCGALLIYGAWRLRFGR